ncbi:MAG: hypothetical protein ABDI07_11530, partial [Candidatus Kryptonium sp.]
FKKYATPPTSERMATSKKNTVVNTEEFILNYNEDLDILELHLPKFAGKKTKITILGEELFFDNTPEVVYLDSLASFDNFPHSLA